MKQQRIDIIGAGISGMSSAYYLARHLDANGRKAEIHLWEKDTTLGGLAGAFETDGFTVEKFYHHIFRRDKDLQALINELSLGDDLIWKPAATGAYYFRRPYRISTPLDVLRFKPLPFLDRIRLGWLAVHARTIKDWRSLDDVSVKKYIHKVAGKNVYDLLWSPLFHGKFGKHAEEISAAWLWSKLVDRGGSRNSQGHELLGYLRGGMGRMFDAIARYLQDKGHRIHVGQAVERLIGEEAGITAIETSEGLFETDAVLGCAQLPELAAILPEHAHKYRASLQKIEFLSNVCLVLTLKHSLSDFYWTNVTESDAPFVGIIEQTNWAAKSDFNHKSLVYISAYVDRDDPRLGMEAKVLVKQYTPAIQKMFPDFHPEIIEHSAIWKADYAQPIVHVGYRHKIPELQTPIPNFFVCSMAQIYPNDRQMSNGVALARKAAQCIIEQLHI